MSNRADLEQWWPVAEARLRVVMRRRVYEADLDDVIAETALRATAHDEFENESHLVAWSVAVAANLVKDEHRRATRRARFAERYVERPNEESVDDVVAELIKRDAMLGRIAELPEQARAALSGDATTDPRERNRARVRKSRALKQLRSYYGRLGIAVGTWRARTWNRVGGSPEAAAGVAAAGLALLGGASLGIDRVRPADPVDDRSGIAAPASVTNAAAFSVAALAPARPAATAGPDARPAATTPATVDYIFRVPVGYSYDGREGSVGSYHGGPEEEGVLLCQGEPGSPGADCLYWPQIVLEVVDLLGD